MDREQLVAELRSVDLFREMDPADVAAVADIVDERVSPPGQHVFFEGDIATEFFGVASGRIRVYVPGDGGELDVGIVREGEMFGEGGMLDGGPRVASAVAIDPSIVLAVPRGAWLRILEERPDLGRRALAAVGASLRRYTSDAIDLLFIDVQIPDFPPEEDLPRV
jgi:CRP-like cAMP-binding protein